MNCFPLGCSNCPGGAPFADTDGGILFHYDHQSETFMNIRAAPSTEADCVVKIEPGAEVIAFERSGDWMRVRLKDAPDDTREMWAVRQIDRNGEPRELLRPGPCPGPPLPPK